jgi:Cdc6-like AAA superfamily ATPase
MSEDLITKVQKEFDTIKPLPLNDRRYVECSAERGSVDLLDRMARAIRRQESTCQLLCGYRGSGKTTELFRLRRLLESKEPRQFVVYCEADRYLNLGDVEYPDVLLGIVQQLWRDANAQEVQLNEGRLESLLAEVVELFKSLSLKEAGIEISLFDLLKGKLATEFRKNPNTRRLIRNHLRDQTVSLLEAINEIISVTKGHFKDKGYGGLVIIVDNLDRMHLKPVANANRNTHESLFLDAGDYLRGLQCDVIYTIPPTLYSTYGPGLKAIYGSQPNLLPMVPVAKYEGGEDEHGIDKLVEIIDKRLYEVGVTRDQAFDSTVTAKRLCAASGGDLRGLMTLMQAACNNRDELPITREALEDAIRSVRDGFISSIRAPEDWQKLRQISQTHDLADPNACARLLDIFAVLEYRNHGGPWWDVNPAIREARQFKP